MSATEPESQGDSTDVIAPRRICRSCQVPLKIPENWSDYRKRTGNYICTPCNRKYQKEYRQSGTSVSIDRVKALQDLRIQKIEELTAFWNDPHYANRAPAERIVEIFREHDITTSESGYTQEEIIEALFPEDLVFDMFTSIEEYMKQSKLTAFTRLEVKSHLIEFIGRYQSDIIQGKRQAAVYKWDALREGANNLYRGTDELIANPPYHNTKTGRNEMRWHLLESQSDVDKLGEKRDRLINGIKNKQERQQDMVNVKQKAKRETAKSKKEQETQQESNNVESEGGETETNDKTS